MLAELFRRALHWGTVVVYPAKVIMGVRNQRRVAKKTSEKGRSGRKPRAQFGGDGHQSGLVDYHLQEMHCPHACLLNINFNLEIMCDPFVRFR